jgi:hypothetical protein
VAEAEEVLLDQADLLTQTIGKDTQDHQIQLQVHQ